MNHTPQEYPEKMYGKISEQKLGEEPPDQPMRVKVRLPDQKAWVTYVFIGLSISVFLLQQLSDFALGGDYPAALGAKVNDAIQAGQLWRLITPVLLHGSLMHIVFNMYALFVIGPGLEKFYGHKRFLMLYLISGFGGNVFSFMFSKSASVGASTAIFGLIAAQALFIFRNRFLFGKNARSMLINVVSIIIINLILGLSPGIDNMGHLGGLLAGLVFGWFAGPILQVARENNEFVLEDSRNMVDAWRMTLIEGSIFTFFAGLWIWLY